MNTRDFNPSKSAPPHPTFKPVRGGLLQRKCACGGTPGPSGECEECRKNKLQRKAQYSELGVRNDSTAPPIVHEVLRSPGQPLDSATLALMEPRFAHDFSHVRVHTNAKAAESARAVNALAYTVGRDMVFGAGEYAPGTSAGRQLIGHELVHTFQQGAETKTSSGQITFFDETPAGRAAENEADKVAGILENARNQPPVAQRKASGLQRQPFGAAPVQVRSPVLEETVTQLSDVAGATTGRPLSADERTLAQGIFGHSLDYDRIRLIPLDALQYRTVGNNTYIPQRFTIANETMAQTLIHELTHIWQYQHGGTSYISISLGTQIAATVQRGNRNYAYDYRITAGKSFFDFTPEQQGFLVENYFAMQRDRSAIPLNIVAGTSRSYESNHLDSTGFKALLSAAVRQSEISLELPLHEPLIQQMQAALPRPEASILLLRASEVMTTPGQNLAPVPPERQLAPIKPFFEVRF